MSTEVNSIQYEIRLFDVLFTIWRKKSIVAIGIIIGVVISVLVSLILPEQFKSSTTFLPISSGGGGSSLSQYAGLAAMAGVSLPASGGDNTRKIQTLLASRKLREKIVKALDLVNALKIAIKPDRDPDREAVTLLEKMVKNSSGKNGEIVLEVESNDPGLAQKIAAQYVIELEFFLNESNLAATLKDQELNERQLAEQNKKLRIAQENLARFQVKNKILDPSSQLQGFTSLVSELYSRKIQLEVQLRQLESVYNPTDTRITAIQSQISSIDSQINDIQTSNTGFGGVSFQDAPEQMIEYQNLIRELEIATKLYAGLLANLAQSTLTTNPEKVFVEVIDPPLVPEVRSSPNRTMIVAVGTFVGFLFSIFGIFLWEGVMKFRNEYLETLNMQKREVTSNSSEAGKDSIGRA